MKMIVSFSTLLVLLACCKEPATPKPPAPPKQLEVVWKTPIIPQNATSGTLGMTPVLYGSEVIFNSEYGLDGTGETVLFFDTADGSLNRNWKDLSGSIYTRETVAHSGDYLLFGEQTSVDCLNLVTCTSQWSGTVSNERPYIYANNGYIYRGFPYGYENGQYNSSRLRRTPAGSNAWQTVYDFTRTDNYRPGFIGCGFGTLPNGDEVVVWKNWSVTPSNSNRADIFAYNLTADSLMWRNTDFMQAANVIPLQVKDGVCYGLLKYSAFAIDLATGNVLWEYDFRDQNNPFLNFAITYFYIDGTRMIIHGENVNNLYYLSTNTGKIIKVVEGIPYPEDRFAYFEGKLFSAGSRLSIVDINTGVDLLKDYDHSEFKSWNSGVTIDPLRRVMYCHDGVYAYCIKIPEL